MFRVLIATGVEPLVLVGGAPAVSGPSSAGDLKVRLGEGGAFPRPCPVAGLATVTIGLYAGIVTQYLALSVTQRIVTSSAKTVVYRL